jgi:hypothetical protein
MRSRAQTFIVPPFNDHLLPHESFPPWQSLLRVAGLVTAALRRRSMTINLKCLEVAVVQASHRIMAVAGGELSPERWHRRVRVAIDKLEYAKLAIVDYVVAKTLDLAEAEELINEIDTTIAQLVEQVGLVPFPDDVRTSLPDLHVPPRFVH